MDDLKNSKGETSEKLFHAKSQRAQARILKLKCGFASLREYLFFDLSEVFNIKYFIMNKGSFQ